METEVDSLAEVIFYKLCCEFRQNLSDTCLIFFPWIMKSSVCGEIGCLVTVAVVEARWSNFSYLVERSMWKSNFRACKWCETKSNKSYI